MSTIDRMGILGKRVEEKKMTVRFNLHMTEVDMDSLIDLSGLRKCSGSQLVRDLIREEAARNRTSRIPE